MKTATVALEMDDSFREKRGECESQIKHFRTRDVLNISSPYIELLNCKA